MKTVGAMRGPWPYLQCLPRTSFGLVCKYWLQQVTRSWFSPLYNPSYWVDGLPEVYFPGNEMLQIQ